MPRRPSAFGDLIEIPRQAQRSGVTRVVDRIGEDGDAVGPQPAKDLNDGESEVQEKRNLEVAPAAVVIVVVSQCIAVSADQ